MGLGSTGLTGYRDGDGVAPLLCRRFTPVDSRVLLFGCFYDTFSRILDPTFLTTAGQSAGEPFNPPSMRAAVAAAQGQLLILKQLRRVWRHCQKWWFGIIWDQRKSGT